MATVTVGSLIDRALRKADMYGSGYIGEQEAMDLFNESWSELYDLIVASFQDYYAVDVQIAISSATDTYALPDDFYKSIGVDFRTGPSNTGYITLRQFTELERNSFYGGVFSQIPSGFIRLRYVPVPQIYTSRDDEVNVLNGFDKYVVNLMAMYMLDKEESSTAVLERANAEMKRRVEEMSQNRDIGLPGRVNDMAVIDIAPQWSTLRYHFTGNNIVLLSQELVGMTYWYY